MNRCDLADFEWGVIEPLLPNKPPGVPRVDGQRVFNGIMRVRRWVIAIPRSYLTVLSIFE